jgi:3-oxoacyl-[acyl-carrier protein] reductase
MRNILITGASRGLGLAMARRLAADGYRVLATARRPTEALDALIAEAGGAVSFRPFDLTETDGLTGFVRALKAEFGPLYGLVNNAGIGTSGLLVNLTPAQIDTLIRLNLTAPVMLTRAAAKPMLAQGAGRIVNVSSIVAGSGSSGLSVYGATKASMIGFTKSLARELGPAGITVNAVAPGMVETDMIGEMSEQDAERIKRRSALRRLAEAQDVAAAVAYLISDDARNVTGAVITVDAGATA